VCRARQVCRGGQRALLPALKTGESVRETHRSARVNRDGQTKTHFQTTTFSPGTYLAFPLAT
jgi:hypothetical protein